MLIRESLLANFTAELFVDVILDVVEEPFGAGQLGGLADAGNDNVFIETFFLYKDTKWV